MVKQQLFRFPFLEPKSKSFCVGLHMYDPSHILRIIDGTCSFDDDIPMSLQLIIDFQTFIASPKAPVGFLVKSIEDPAVITLEDTSDTLRTHDGVLLTVTLQV